MRFVAILISFFMVIGVGVAWLATEFSLVHSPKDAGQLLLQTIYNVTGLAAFLILEVQTLRFNSLLTRLKDVRPADVEDQQASGAIIKT